MELLKFENTQVFNIEGAMRGMRFPMKGKANSVADDISEKDMKVAKSLHKLGVTHNAAHCKYLRQILVSVDITAPLYFWSEFDTYAIGVTKNSESTMHKLIKDAENLNVSDFLFDPELGAYFDLFVIPKMKNIANDKNIDNLKKLRLLKQLLPTSFYQKRHWTGNYEVIRNMYNQRVIDPHRLVEWSGDKGSFKEWAESLPYAKEFIMERYQDEDISD